MSPLLYFYRSKCLHDSHTILAIRIACHRRESAPIREFYKEQHKNLLSVDAEKSIWWVFNAAKTEVEKSVTHIQNYIQKTSISKWTYTMNKFYFCQNHDISTSSCMLLHQPYDWRCNPDLVKQIINGRSFFQLSGSSIDIWCNVQKIFQSVSQKFLWYNCNKVVLPKWYYLQLIENYKKVLNNI